MRKVLIGILVVLLAVPIFYFQLITVGANEKEPKMLYKVYLDGELIGSIESKNEL